MRKLLVILGSVLGLMLGFVSVSSAASPLNPVGNIDGFSYDGSLKVSGWAFDPETPSPIDVHVYVDGSIRAIATADSLRYDIAGVYPSYGPSHGWSFALGRLSIGAHTVCVYAINVGQGDTNPALGCRSLTVAGNPALNPVGNVDQIALIEQGLFVAGWAFDPETPASIDVHAYIDGSIAQISTAVGARADIAAVYPAYGPNHGFSLVAPTPGPGQHQVCIYAINVGDGTTNPAIGCRSFTVAGAPTPPPAIPARQYQNCDAMHIDFPHGVGLANAVDHVSGGGIPVTNFAVRPDVYNINAARLDGDDPKDGIACEQR